MILATLDELKESSDLLVRGSVTASTDVKMALTDDPDYPEHLGTLHDGVELDIKELTFNVDEYYKGEGPTSISIMVDVTGGAPVSLDVGTSYVLYLFDGGDVWGDSYLVQALRQGVWVVDGENATREVGDVKTVPLSRFSETEPTPSPEETPESKG